MRKSTLMLMIAGFLAMAWTGAYYWMAGSSIRELRAGENGRFLKPPPPADDFIRIPLMPMTAMDVAGCNLILLLEQDSAYSIGLRKSTHQRYGFYSRDSLLILRMIHLPEKQDHDTIRIGFPGIRRINLYGYPVPGRAGFIAELSRLAGGALSLKTRGLSGLTITGCAASDMAIQSTESRQSQQMTIAASCRFDSLTIRFDGPGSLDLGTAGTFRNSLFAGDSVLIRSSVPVLEKIMKPEPLPVKKP